METNTMPAGFEVKDIYTGGRPKKVYIIDGKEVSKWDFEQKLSGSVLPTPILRPKGMDAESFSEFCRQAAPNLVQRMYELATQSEDIRAIAIVAKELADRAFGKSTQAVQVSVDSRVREAWNIIDVKEITDETSQGRNGGDGTGSTIPDDPVEAQPTILH